MLKNKCYQEISIYPVKETVGYCAINCLWFPAISRVDIDIMCLIFWGYKVYGFDCCLIPRRPPALRKLSRGLQWLELPPLSQSNNGAVSIMLSGAIIRATPLLMEPNPAKLCNLILIIERKMLWVTFDFVSLSTVQCQIKWNGILNTD